MSRLSLLPSIAAHLVLGAVLLTILWSAGFGLVLRVTRARAFSSAALALGYPVGLCVAFVVTALLVASPVVGLVALVLPAAGIVFLLRAKWVFPSLKPPLHSALLAAPFIGVFGVLLGLVYHGPTAERNSSVGGDMLWYIAKFHSAQVSLRPYNDLLFSGQHFTFTEGAPTFLGAALAWLPGFDPFLFDAVTLPVMFGLAIAAGIGSLALVRGGTRPRADRYVGALAAIGAAAVLYPSWVVESPPVALAVPLAFAVFWFARSPLTISAFVVQGGVIAVALALTKVLGLVFLAGVMLGRVCLRDVRWDVPRLRSVATVVAALVAGAACVGAMIPDSGGFFVLLTHVHFTPLDHIRNASAQAHTGLHLPWGIATLAGQLLVLVALLRSRELVLAGAFAIAILVSWIEAGVVDFTGISLSLLAAVCVYLLNPDEFRRQRLLLIGAGGCLGLAALGQEFSGTYLGPALFVSLAAAVFAATRQGLRLYPARALLEDVPLFVAYVLGMAIWLGGRHAAAVVLVWPAVVLGWAALGHLTDGRRRELLSAGAALVAAAVSLAYIGTRATLPAESGRVTSDEFRFWTMVGRAVPEDGLVFTSFTGETVTQQTGWNYYPAVARRQVYLGGWADNPIIADRARLTRLLALNSQVLAGAIAPTRVATERRFRSYYAAVDSSARVPSSFVPVRRVGSYALYRIT